MTAYFDTSILLPLFFREAGTGAARAELAGASAIWASHWTLAEFASATAFKLRSGQTDGATAAEARDLFRSFTASMLTVVDVIREDFAAAGQLCIDTPPPGLRTPDALHLAVARRHGLTLVTLDAALAHACAQHGVAHRMPAAA